MLMTKIGSWIQVARKKETILLFIARLQYIHFVTVFINNLSRKTIFASGNFTTKSGTWCKILAFALSVQGKPLIYKKKSWVFCILNFVRFSQPPRALPTFCFIALSIGYLLPARAYVLVIYVKRSQSECHVVIRHTTKNLSTAGTVPQPSAHLDKLQLFESTRCNKIRAKDENLRDMFTIVGVCTRSHEKLVNFLY